MFEFGRELMRLFGAEPAFGSSEGLTGGDGGLLELLDVRLLLQEARAADIAAGRIGAKDKPERRLEAVRVWREAARRTGDVVHLRKAAATAEAAAEAMDRGRRSDGWALARCEQAFCALAGADLFGDSGLTVAAGAAFREARASARGGLAAALAETGLAALAGREALARGDADQAMACADRLAAPIAALEALGRRRTAARSFAAETRLMRAELLCGFGARLNEPTLLELAIQEAAAASRRVNPDYEPLTWARTEMARGRAMTLWGARAGDVEAVASAAAVFAQVLEQLPRDHSPLDWARAQLGQAETLRALGEAGGDARAIEQAVTCHDRARLALQDIPAMPLRGLAAEARAVCLARSAELTGDLAVLDVAEAAVKIELGRLQPRRDPVAWAIAQLHLARLYEARLDLTGKDRGQRAAGLLALDAALDIFAEEGLCSLAAAATEALERLRVGRRARRTV